MTAIQANGIAIEVERHGPEDGAPLLLIRGLGTQLIHWPERLIRGFVANGFHVIVFDNRDAGLSQKFDDRGVPDFADLQRKLAAGEKPETPYTIEDMAADAAGVLEALAIPAAHVFGISMGGMILQVMARRFPDRVLSATIVMSSSGDPALPGRPPEVEALLLAEPEQPVTRESYIAFTLKCDRVWGSPGYPFDEAERSALIGRAFDRAHCPQGIARQYAAVLAGGPRSGWLGEIRVPTLVIHGTDDVLVPLEHGRDIARRIPGAELLVVEGMGHDLEGGIADIAVAATTRLARHVDAARRGASGYQPA